MKKSFLSVFLLAFFLTFFTACSDSDSVVGTWVQEDSDLGKVTWVFNEDGSCVMSNSYFDDMQGVYELSEEGDTMTILMDLWGSTKEDAEEYTVKILDDSLSLKSNGFAVSYELKRQ